MVIKISDADTNLQVSELLARIRFSGERIIIEHQGTPVAAVVSVEDLKHLELEQQGQPATKAERLAALAMADASRRAILEDRHGIPLPDSSRLIEEMREERDREISGMH